MISGVILAAGKGSRMGKDKLSLILEDRPILEHVILSAKQSKLDEILLIWGGYTNSKLLGEKHGLMTVENKDFEFGMSTSVIAGLKHISPRSKATVFLLGDMPFVKSRHIDCLIDTYEYTSKGIVVPTFNGKRGNPVVFSSRYYEEMMQLTGDAGARTLIEKYQEQVTTVAFGEENTLIDIDTQAEYRKYVGRNLDANSKI